MAETRTFALTLLGTDTLYAAKLKAPIVRVDTLSAIHDAFETAEAQDYTHKTHKDLKSLGDDQFSKIFELGFASDIPGNSKAVIDGADTFGSAVYHRVAMASLMILQQTALGATNVNINGHSRGAVEALVVAHEIDRIKKIILDNREQSTDDIYALIVNKKSGSDEDKEIKKQYRSTDKRQKLLKSTIEKIKKDLENTPVDGKAPLEELKLNIFGIDPVPGTMPGVSIDRKLSWKNEKFHYLADCVEKCQIIYAENEHSAGFQSIVINPDSRLKVDALPGNHATACGNFNYQGRKECNLVGITHWGRPQNLSHVQDVTFLNMLDFMRDLPGVRFEHENIEENTLDSKEVAKLPKIEGRPPVASIKSLCERFTKEFVEDRELFDREKYFIYKQVKRNLAGYIKLEGQTYYSGRGNLGARIYMDKNRYRCHRSEFIPLPSGFVSSEHHKLFISDKLAGLLSSDDSPVHVANTGLELSIQIIVTTKALLRNIHIKSKNKKYSKPFLILNEDIKHDLNDCFKFVALRVFAEKDNKETLLKVMSQIVSLINEADKYQNGHEIIELVRRQILSFAGYEGRKLRLAYDNLNIKVDNKEVDSDDIRHAIDKYNEFARHINELDKLRRILNNNSEGGFDLFVSSEFESYLSGLYETEHKLRVLICNTSSHLSPDKLDQFRVINQINMKLQSDNVDFDSKSILAHHNKWKRAYIDAKHNNHESLVYLADDIDLTYQAKRSQVALEHDRKNKNLASRFKEFIKSIFHLPSNITLNMAFSLVITSTISFFVTLIPTVILFSLAFTIASVLLTPAIVVGVLCAASLIGVMFYGAYLAFQSCYKYNDKDIDKKIAKHSDCDSDFDSDVEEIQANHQAGSVQVPVLVSFKDIVQAEDREFDNIIKRLKDECPDQVQIQPPLTLAS